MKKHTCSVFVLLLAVILLSGAFLTVTFAEDDPQITIVGGCLSLEDSIRLQYAVSYIGVDLSEAEIGMRFWSAEPTDPMQPDTEEYTVTATLGWEMVGDTKCWIFQYPYLAATQMCDTIWAQAWAKVNGKTIYSDVLPYSITTYAENMLYKKDEAIGEPLYNLIVKVLEYGEAAQLYKGIHTDVLPTDILYRYTVTFDGDNGTDTTTQIAYRNRHIIAPKIPSKQYYQFLGWFHGDEMWDFETDKVTQDITLTAHWEITYSSGLKYYPNGDGVQVSGRDTCTDTFVRIPSVSPSGEKVTAITTAGFNDCFYITSVLIPDSVTRINSGAFAGCRNLKSIIFQGTKAQWNDITFGNGWNSNTGNYVIHCTDGDISKS